MSSASSCHEDDVEDEGGWPDFSLEKLFCSPRASEASTISYVDENSQNSEDHELRLAAEATAEVVTPAKKAKGDAKPTPKKKISKVPGKKQSESLGRWQEWWLNKAQFFEMKTEKGKNMRIMIRGYYPDEERWRQLAEV